MSTILETIEATRPPAPPSKRSIVMGFGDDKWITGEDLLRHPEWGPCELIRGKVVPVCRPNFEDGRLVTRLAGKMDDFAEEHGLGMVVSGDSGVYLERNPDTVKGPDIYFVRAANCPTKDAAKGYLETAPDLCVEIMSPNDLLADVEKKVAQYLGIGVKLIWLIDPKLRSARIFRADKSVAFVPADGRLSGEDVLPGFEIALAKLFGALEVKPRP